MDANRPHRATALHDQLTNDDNPGDFSGDTAARATPDRLAIRSTLTAKAL
ncbi:hypothetical protein GCM10027575_29790 [Phytohabitans suffuscus]